MIPRISVVVPAGDSVLPAGTIIPITRAVIGFCGDAIHCASASRRPDVWPSERGISVGGFPKVITSMKPGFICDPRFSASPRIKKYDGGTS